jgi:SAM-dependent methyltransferase
VRVPDFRSAARNGLVRVRVALRAIADRAHPTRAAARRAIDRLAPSRRVDRYWTRTLVDHGPFATPEDSEAQLESRFDQYPLFREFSGLWGDHRGEVVLDYGCGPGNDVVGFLLYSGAARVFGMDVSPKALALAAERIALHGVDERRFRLIELTDADPAIPLEDEAVDFFQSQGVLHHTSDPAAILRELHRVAKRGAEARVMVYNRESVWFHLWTACELQLWQGRYSNLTTEDAFERTTDGPDCPIARCYRPEDFIALCEGAGFEAEFLGGYPSQAELDWLRSSRDRALADKRVGAEHRDFLRELELDPDGYPMWRGKHAGVGGSYLLRRPGP